MRVAKKERREEAEPGRDQEGQAGRKGTAQSWAPKAGEGGGTQ